MPGTVFSRVPRRSAGRALPCLMVACVGMAFSGAALAQESPQSDGLIFLGQPASITLGVGAMAAPIYEGANKYRTSPFPLVDIRLLNNRVFLSGAEGLGVNILSRGPLTAGIALGYGMGRRSSYSDRLSGLKDLPSEAAIVGFVNYDLRPFSVGLKVKNYFGPNPGTEVALGGQYTIMPFRNFSLSAGPRVTWADSRYDKAHFGVTADQAAAATAAGNPLTAYSPGSGIKDVGLTLTGVYQIGPHWQWMTHAGLTELVSTAARNSPLTQRDFQPSVGTGFAYRF
jgi:MipA family protein